MVEAKKKTASHWWWFDSHNKTNSNAKRSSWLQSTLAELDEKTQAMLRLIEEDADSFAQRAEMYYKKRPELISMVEDIYRSHRLLAERYDQIKSESGSRLLSPWASPLSSIKSYHRLEKPIVSSDKAYDSYSETCEVEESDESEVDDPEQQIQPQKEMQTEEVSSGLYYDDDDEMEKLRNEIEKLREENRMQKEKLLEKDEEKREVIRQLSLAVDLLKEENNGLRKSAYRHSPKKQNKEELNRLKDAFWKKLFN